jgi:hypothetical protein
MSASAWLGCCVCGCAGSKISNKDKKLGGKLVGWGDFGKWWVRKPRRFVRNWVQSKCVPTGSMEGIWGLEYGTHWVEGVNVSAEGGR